jgi:hypothetical protein
MQVQIQMGFIGVARTPFLAAIFYLYGDFCEKNANDYVNTLWIPQTNHLSRNLAAIVFTFLIYFIQMLFVMMLLHFPQRMLDAISMRLKRSFNNNCLLNFNPFLLICAYIAWENSVDPGLSLEGALGEVVSQKVTRLLPCLSYGRTHFV